MAGDPRDDALDRVLGRRQQPAAQAEPAADPRDAALDRLLKPAQQTSTSSRSADEAIDKLFDLRVQQMEAALGNRPVQSFNEAMKETRARLGPDAQTEIDKSAPAKRNFQQLSKSARLLAAELSEPKKSEFQKLIKAGTPYALSAMEKAAAVLDTPRRLASKALVGGSGSVEETEKRIAESESPLAKAFNYITSGAGKYGELAFRHYFPDLESADKLIAAGVEPKEALQQTRLASSGEEGKRFAQSMALDPTTYLTFGAKSGSTQVMKQAERALEGTSQAKRAAGMMSQAYEKFGGTPQMTRQLERINRAAGGTTEALEKSMGKGGEFAGLSGAELGIPFGPKVELASLAAPLGIPAHATRRVLKPVGQALRALPGPARAFEGSLPERTFVEREAAKARHGTVNRANEAFRDFEENIASIAPPEAKRREELIRHFVDPDYTTGPTGAVRASAPPAGVAAPSVNEQQWMDKLNDFFDVQGRELLSAGVIEKLERNLATGRYVPRQFLRNVPGNPWWNRLRNWFDKATQPDFPGTISNPLHARTSDTPLGRAATQGIPHVADPHKMVGEYAPRAARAVERAKFEKALEKGFGKGNVPKEALARLESMFGGRRIPIYDRALSIFKENQLLNVPRFHLVNWLEDSAKMAAAHADARSVRLGERALTDAAHEVIGTTPAGRRLTAGELRTLGARNGFLSSPTAHDFDFARGPNEAVARFNRAAEKGAGIGALRRYARGAKEAPLQTAIETGLNVGSLGARPLGKLTAAVPGEKLAKAWDARSKMALFVDGLMKGMPENVAAKRVADTLFDSATSGRAMRGFQRLVPFGGYTARTARTVPRLVLQNPKIATAQMRAAEAFSSGDPTSPDQLPTYVRERGLMKQAGPQTASAVRNAISAIAKKIDPNAQPVNPGLGVAMMPRGFLLEGLAPALELAGGNLDPARQMLSPVIAPLANWDYNPTTKQAYTEPFQFDRPFAPGTPGVPTELQAFEGAPNAAQYAAPFLPRLGTTALNLAAQMTGAPGPVLGVQRPYASDAAQRAAAELLGLGTGISPYLTNPMQIQREAGKKVEEASKIRTKRKREKKADTKAKARRKE